MRIMGYASLRFPLALAGSVLLGCVACAHATNTPAARGCEVSDLDTVFRNPVSYVGRKFCGEVLGVPQGPGITFFPPNYDYPSRFYDVAMFFSDRRMVDRLRLSQTRPFRVHVEGRIRPVEECFSTEAAQREIECTPIRRPIILQVSRIGIPVATDGR